jgi:hypothetical protein
MCTNSVLRYYTTRIVFQVDPVREGNDTETRSKTSDLTRSKENEREEVQWNEHRASSCKTHLREQQSDWAPDVCVVHVYTCPRWSCHLSLATFWKAPVLRRHVDVLPSARKTSSDGDSQVNAWKQSSLPSGLPRTGVRVIR